MIVYMAAKSVVLSPEDCRAVGEGCLPISTTHNQLFSFSSQAPKAAGKPNTRMAIHFWYHLSGWLSDFFGQRGPDNRGSTVMNCDCQTILTACK